MTDSVDEVVALATEAPARLGGTRLIAVDGPAGSGKSTLSHEVARRLKGRVLRMDDLYPGWDGLFEVDSHVLTALRPLLDGDLGYYRRYDWEAAEYRETRRLLPVPHLVIEGVGAGNRAWSAWTSVLVWMECPSPDERLRRTLARDGEAAQALLEKWMIDEQRLFAQEGTRERADLVVTT